MKTRGFIISIYLMILMSLLASCVRADGMHVSKNGSVLWDTARDGDDREILIEAKKDSSLHFVSSDDAIKYMRKSVIHPIMPMES